MVLGKGAPRSKSLVAYAPWAFLFLAGKCGQIYDRLLCHAPNARPLSSCCSALYITVNTTQN